MDQGKTVKECEQIARTMNEDSDGHEMAGCPMGQGGIYVHGGSGDDTVIIAKSDQDVDAAIARWEAEGSGRPSKPGTLADGSTAARPKSSENQSVELAVIGLFVIVAAFIFVIKLLGRGDA